MLVNNIGNSSSRVSGVFPGSEAKTYFSLCFSRVSGGDPESLFETYKKEHGSERLCSQGEPVPDSNHALSIPNIQELLGIVKNGRSRVSGGDPGNDL